MNDDDQRREVRALLEGGLDTEEEPRGDSDESRMSILARIKKTGSTKDKIKIAGFTLHPVNHDGIEEACEACMYYLVRRRYCELPEIALAVEPQWSCRVWRI